MGFYRERYGTETPPLKQRWELPPAWYGLGCFFAVLIPVVAFFGGMVAVQQGVQRGLFRVPQELILREPLPWLPWYDPYLPAYAVAGVGIALLLYIGLSAFYALLYRFIGGSPYLPVDIVDD